MKNQYLVFSTQYFGLVFGRRHFGWAKRDSILDERNLAKQRIRFLIANY